MRAKQQQKTAAIYARFSSHLQREESIDQQVAECRAFAKANGITITAVYADEAMSGRTDRRPQFQKLKRDAEKGIYTHILAYKSNRLARNMIDALRFEGDMQALGVQVLYAKEEFGNNAAGRFALRTMMNVNQFYSENMGEDIKRALHDNVRTGKVNGVVPLGYRKSADGKYEIVPEEAAIVREIFERVCSGWRNVDICADLTARGIAPKSGKTWNANSIPRMLNNKKYIGVYEFGDMLIDDVIPPIVSRDQFEDAQEKLGERRIARISDDSFFILTGKLFCGECGERMIGISGTSHTGDKHYYYSCKNARKGECEKKNAQKAKLERFVSEKVYEAVSDPAVVAWVCDQIDEYQRKQEDSPEKTLVAGQLADVKTALRNIMTALEAGIFNDTTQARMIELEERKKALESDLARLRRNDISIDREDVETFFSEALRGDLEDPAFRAALIKNFVTRVILYDDRVVIVRSFDGKAEDFSPEEISETGSTGVTLYPYNANQSNHMLCRNKHIVLICALE